MPTKSLAHQSSGECTATSGFVASDDSKDGRLDLIYINGEEVALYEIVIEDHLHIYILGRVVAPYEIVIEDHLHTIGLNGWTHDLAASFTAKVVCSQTLR